MTDALVIEVRVRLEPTARCCCKLEGSRHERAVLPSVIPQTGLMEGVPDPAKTRV